LPLTLNKHSFDYKLLTQADGMNKNGMNKKWIFTFILCVGVVVPSWSKQHNTNFGDIHWVGTWASSAQLVDKSSAPPEPGLSNTTLRQIIHVSIGGQRIRVRFSNAFGSTPLAIVSAHIALPNGGSKIKPESDKPLTFNGQQSVTIPSGALMISDPIDFNLAPLSDLAITIRLNGVPELITTHSGSRETSYIQSGDSVSAEDLPSAAHTDHWYFINGVDVQEPKDSAAIVALGDSITDGHGATTNGNDRWTDDLARRLQADKHTRNISVLNQGIGGNRLLHDGLGPNALERIDRDVLAQTGVHWLIVFEGVNDIGTRAWAERRHEQAASADDIIAAYEQIITRAHAHGIRVYGATITPFGGSFYDSPDAQSVWSKVNDWIRSSGQFDGIIDLAKLTADPASPSHLRAADDSGDHLHPGSAGYKAMADSIDLRLFQ
jgi:lysophospholipase L1-like esterase